MLNIPFYNRQRLKNLKLALGLILHNIVKVLCQPPSKSISESLISLLSRAAQKTPTRYYLKIEFLWPFCGCIGVYRGGGYVNAKLLRRLACYSLSHAIFASVLFLYSRQSFSITKKIVFAYMRFLGFFFYECVISFMVVYFVLSIV